MITRTWLFLITTLANQRAIVEEIDIIYDSPSETVPEQCFSSNSGYFSNNKEVKHILESAYKKVLVKYQYQQSSPVFAELRKKNLYLACVMVGH